MMMKLVPSNYNYRNKRVIQPNILACLALALSLAIAALDLKAGPKQQDVCIARPHIADTEPVQAHTELAQVATLNQMRLITVPSLTAQIGVVW